MESNNDIKDQSRRRRRNTYPDGIAIEPRDILQELNGGEESSTSTSLETETRQPQQCEADASATADLFVTMVRSNLLIVFYWNIIISDLHH